MYLYKKGDSQNWWCEFRLKTGPNKGKKVRRTTGETARGRAEIRAGGIRAELEAEAAAEPVPEPLLGPALVDLAGYDLARAEAKGVSQLQYDSIRNSWRHLCRGLGTETDSAALTYDDVEDYIRHRRQKGTRGQSIRKETQALKRGMTIARRKGLLEEVIEMPEIASDPPRISQQGKLHPLPVLWKWLEALKTVPLADGARAQAEVVLYTGLRSKEVRRLSMGWVEQSPNSVREDTQVSYLLRVPAWAAKTRRERVIGLTDEVVAILNRESRGKAVDTPLFSSDHHKTYKATALRIGYHQPITLRDLRHCYATLSAQGTGDAAATQAALGHSRLETTQRYLTATLTRTASASTAVALAMSAHRSSPTADKNGDREDPQKQKTQPEGWESNRGERTRTSGLLLPKDDTHRYNPGLTAA